MSYLDWKAGDKIVCIAEQAKIDAIHATLPGSVYPKSGSVYTIREVRDDSPMTGGREQIVVLLSEIDNSGMIGSAPLPGKRCFVEPGFNPKGFRPVQTRTTDISSLQALLLNPFVTIGEDA
jgi:hypothetical protein